MTDSYSESAVTTQVAYAPELFGADGTTPEVAAVAIQHVTGCGCAACGSMRDEEQMREGSIVANDAGDELGGAAVSAPSALGDMADYIRETFWNSFGTVPREFNLTSSGLNPKNGVLHYNVSGFSNSGGAGTDTNGITAARADLVRDVLDVYSEVLGITFVETSSSDISFTDFFFKDTDAGRAYANSAGFSSGIQYSWINVGQDWSGGTSTYNDYTLQTIFHEVGHALGLGHQGLYNGTGAYPSDADFENDSWQATMMSYFSQTENTSIPASFAFLQTPMSVDWMALQDIYGDQSYNGVTFGTGNAFTGNTVYGFNTNISSATSNIWAEFATYANRTASTIIDAGGIDTLDFSGYSATQLINLAPTNRTDTAPSTSNIGGLTGNLTIAEGTIIENAIGGSGADTFFGNDADNTFTGNAGNDTFNDSAGSDTYLGGAGSDTVNFQGLFSSYSFSLSGAFLQVVNVVTDLVRDTVEFLSFSDQLLGFQDIVDGLGGSNSAPTAVADGFTTDEDTALSSGNLLLNDTDADGDTLEIASVEGAAGNVGTAISLASGALLTVNADGTFDYDPNGGFDSLTEGQSAQDSFVYTVTDGTQTSDSATVTITVTGSNDMIPTPTGAIGESGVVSVSQASGAQWHSVLFSETIENAVVVLGPATNNDSAPITTRVRNVTETGFEFQIDEWDYLDGVHGTEQIGWLAVSEGTHQLEGGGRIVADTATVGTGLTAVGFGTSLTAAVVLAETSTVNEASAVTTRLENVSATGFDLQLQEEEAGGTHALETVSWIALEAGQNATYSAFVTPDEVRASPQTYALSGFSQTPVLLADLQTADGADTATTRLDALASTSVSLFVEEEQSMDAELGHTSEAIGVVAMGGGLIYAAEGVNQAPSAGNDTVTVAEGATVILDVLSNDADPDGDALSIASINGQSVSVGGSVTLASGALVSVQADQRLVYDQNGAFDALSSGQSGVDLFTYQVTDGTNAPVSADVTVTVNGEGSPVPTMAIGQSGAVTVSQLNADQWHSVTFDAAISDAVVVLGPVSSNDDAPLTTRLRNVTDTGFEFQIDEWEYLDGTHGSETLGWLAISEGSHTLSTGQTIVAGTSSVGTNFSSLSFGETLTNAVVFADVASVNDGAAVTTRLRNITDEGFQARIQEEEAGGAHLAETVSWIAVESGSGTGLEAARASGTLDQVADDFLFNTAFSQAPVLLADMQSTNGGDTATLRLSGLDTAGFSAFVEEEKSANVETSHAGEAVGYLALDEGLIYVDSFLL